MVLSSPPPPSAVFLKSAFPLTFSPEFLSHQATHPSHSRHISTPEPERAWCGPRTPPSPRGANPQLCKWPFLHIHLPRIGKGFLTPTSLLGSPPPFFFLFPPWTTWAAEGRLRAPSLLDGKSELVIPKVPAGLAPTYPFYSDRGPVLLSFFRTFFPPCLGTLHSTS